ncbi:MAG TPA: TIGR00730 family Rossman fold protein [Bacteroidales bacterium]|nr:TIGR00730 family Rossman fold protein [Bacteroidales bacterium]HRW94379.1 TIGR00730 family Rossman fold protein [Bacteroidales bacterium]
MQRVSVFCGSRKGNNPEIIRQAALLGELLAKKGIELVYGGTRVGIMGVLADSVLAHGGTVEGIMPALIEEKKIAHEKLTKMVQVADLEERKQRLISNCDAILVFPGSYGTMDEMFNALVYKQLDKIQKPVILLNIGGFYDPLLLQLERMVATGFMPERFYRNLQVVTDCQELDFLAD